MKRVIRSNDIALTDRQVKKLNQLYKAYQAVFDILDDKEFNEEGEFFPLLNNPNIADEISDELIYLDNL